VLSEHAYRHARELDFIADLKGAQRRVALAALEGTPAPPCI
jgi:hypothetical protein